MTTSSVYSNGLEQKPYWLATTGVDAVSFIKQTTPPLAWFNRGILYELDDGNLYFNGRILEAGTDIDITSITYTQEAANPGGADTVWMSSGSTPPGHIFHGAHDTENYDPQVLWVGSDVPNGTLTLGATGAVNNPFNNMDDALSLWSPAGLSVLASGIFTDPIALDAQTAISGLVGPSFRGVIVGDIALAGGQWDLPSPFTFNQATLSGLSIVGLVDFQDAGMDSPLLIINDCSVGTGLQTNGDATSLANGRLVVKDSIISAPVSLNNTNAYFTGCQYGLFGFAPAYFDISHDETLPMEVMVDGVNIRSSGVVDIAADSATSTLTVSLIGWAHFGEVNVNSVDHLGALVLIVDDIPPITWAPGTEALTTLVYAKQADMTGYTPAVPGDWAVPPTEVASALDALAAAGGGDVVGPASATDNAIVAYDGASGKLIKNTTVTVASGALAGVVSITDDGVNPLELISLGGNNINLHTGHVVMDSGSDLAVDIIRPATAAEPLILVADNYVEARPDPAAYFLVSTGLGLRLGAAPAFSSTAGVLNALTPITTVFVGAATQTILTIAMPTNGQSCAAEVRVRFGGPAGSGEYIQSFLARSNGVSLTLTAGAVPFAFAETAAMLNTLSSAGAGTTLNLQFTATSAGTVIGTVSILRA